MTATAAGSTAKKRRARRHFDRWSRKYEEDKVSRWIAEIQASAFDALALGPDDRFLDVGCGSGAAVRKGAAVAKRSVGVDLSTGMINRARQLARDLDNTEFFEGDSEELPFGEGEFTAVLCTTSSHHYPDPQAAIGEMARVLAPSGRLVIADPCKDNRLAGLVNLVLRTLQRSHVSFYSSRRMAEFIGRGGLRLEDTRLVWSGW